MRLMTWNINSLVRSALHAPQPADDHLPPHAPEHCHCEKQVPTVRNFVLTNGSFQAWLHEHNLQIACFQVCTCISLLNPLVC